MIDMKDQDVVKWITNNSVEKGFSDRISHKKALNHSDQGLSGLAVS